MSRFLLVRSYLAKSEQAAVSSCWILNQISAGNKLHLSAGCHLTSRPNFGNRGISLTCFPQQQRKSALTESSHQSDLPSTSVKEKVKETTKTAWYSSVIIAGVGVTAFILYYIFNELFSRDSANNVYSAALKRCLGETKIQDVLGEPIKGFGEETRRGRRQHVSHLLYEKDGVNYLRMKFYLKGSRKQATVHLEMKENQQTKHFEYRYLFVQADDISRQVVILEDNRAAVEPTMSLSSLPPLSPLPELNLSDR